jgi:hypothetical protein
MGGIGMHPGPFGFIILYAAIVVFAVLLIIFFHIAARRRKGATVEEVRHRIELHPLQQMRIADVFVARVGLFAIVVTICMRLIATLIAPDMHRPGSFSPGLVIVVTTFASIIPISFVLLWRS